MAGRKAKPKEVSAADPEKEVAGASSAPGVEDPKENQGGGQQDPGNVDPSKDDNQNPPPPPAPPTPPANDPYIIYEEFRDKNDFAKVYYAGDDASHFPAERLEVLIKRGLVGRQSEQYKEKE